MGGANRDKINGILGELSKGRGKFKEDEFNAEELVETFTEKEKEAEKTGKPKMGMDNPEER